jgi:hypothetical protein
LASAFSSSENCPSIRGDRRLSAGQAAQPLPVLVHQVDGFRQTDVDGDGRGFRVAPGIPAHQVELGLLGSRDDFVHDHGVIALHCIDLVQQDLRRLEGTGHLVGQLRVAQLAQMAGILQGVKPAAGEPRICAPCAQRKGPHQLVRIVRSGVAGLKVGDDRLQGRDLQDRQTGPDSSHRPEVRLYLAQYTGKIPAQLAGILLILSPLVAGECDKDTHHDHHELESGAPQGIDGVSASQSEHVVLMSGRSRASLDKVFVVRPAATAAGHTLRYLGGLYCPA